MIVPKLRSPIVLVHGLLGYDRLSVFGFTVATYFPGIAENLREAGNRVLVPCLSPTDGVAKRAAQLKEFLEREAPGEPVHLIAHSMGGLDSRYLISRLGMAPNVLSLTTIGTPHRGTVFADWLLQRFGEISKPIFQYLAIPFQAFYDLSTSACRIFNQETPDAPNVRYFSVAGRHENRWHAPEWQFSYPIVERAEGPNDGVVSLQSAQFGESFDVWPGDHMSLVNWLNPLALRRGICQERKPQYAGLVRRLADEGF